MQWPQMHFSLALLCRTLLFICKLFTICNGWSWYSIIVHNLPWLVFIFNGLSQLTMAGFDIQWLVTTMQCLVSGGLFLYPDLSVPILTFLAIGAKVNFIINLIPSTYNCLPLEQECSLHTRYLHQLWKIYSSQSNHQLICVQYYVRSWTW